MSTDHHGPEFVEASTQAGDVRGLADSSGLAFMGIPYGSTTGGANRFRPPLPALEWEGTRAAFLPGPAAPQVSTRAQLLERPPTVEQFLFYRDQTAFTQSEDCLRANVWTPDLAGARPVMVFLHGGGLAYGSGTELLTYDGANLSGSEDVVVVTFNHRLNVLGFTDLSSYSGFEESANLGLQDAVLLLRWISMNISAFGGDPNNVTIFGQSGGGVKVAALMSMPSAAGLFHKAIIQSGSFWQAADPDEANRQTQEIVRRAGARDPEDLSRIPLNQLMVIAEDIGISAFRPSIDGSVISEPLIGAPNARGRDAMSARIPMIIGSCQNEFVSGLSSPTVSMTQTQLREAASELYGDNASAAIERMSRLHGDEEPFGLYAALSARGVRDAVVQQLEAKTAQGGAAWSYMFCWRTPVLGGELGTFHSADLALAFKNADRCRRQTGGGDAAMLLQDQIGGAWASFAKTGNPAAVSLPNWPQWSAGRPTMLFDSPSAVHHGWDDELLSLDFSQHRD